LTVSQTIDLTTLGSPSNFHRKIDELRELGIITFTNSYS